VSTPPDRGSLRRRYERRSELTAPAEPALLAGLPLFAGIPERARGKVIERLLRYTDLVSFSEGEEILREGEYSDSAYYIISGAIEVVLAGMEARPQQRPKVRGGAHVSGPGRGARPGAEPLVGRGGSGNVSGRTVLAAGEIFGELSALSRYPVSATVRAENTVRLLQIRLPGLRMLTATSAAFKESLDERYRMRALGQHLQSIELFSSLPREQIEGLTARAELVSYDPGQVIVEEGATAQLRARGTAIGDRPEPGCRGHATQRRGE